MFGKLLKYEFKSLSKWYLSLYALAFAVSLIFGLTARSAIHGRYYDNPFLETSTGIMGGGILFVFGALFISTIIIIIKRFNDNILGRQGYLTMTLPVSIHAILWSKIIVSSLLFASMSFALVVCASLMTLAITGSFGQFLITIGYFFEGIGRVFAEYGFTLILLFIYGVLALINFIVQMYLAMAIGHLTTKNRVRASYFAYFGIASILAIINSFLGISPYYNEYLGLNSASVLTVLSLYHIVVLLISYRIIHYIIKNKLNIL